MHSNAWLEDFLIEVLRMDTHVPLGETEVQPGEPRIVAAVDQLLAHVESFGPQETRRHEMGDLAVRFGPQGDDGILLQTYIVGQHANLMEGPSAARIVDGAEYGRVGPSALGMGATQNKGPMASMFDAVRRIASTPLSKPVWLAVNTEGRSSHGGSMRVIDDLGVTAAGGIVAFGTNGRISLGNRGRVDVKVRVKGESCHSSQPWLGRNPIEGAADVVRALRDLPLPDAHPILGGSSATPYQFACHPVAPHTIPEEARMVIDRRLLPGEEPDEAVDGIRAHLERMEEPLEVTPDVAMLPAEVGRDEAVVRALLEGMESAGLPPETFWSRNTYDAGYACSKGIPSPMFGPGERSFGADMVGVDLVSIADCRAASDAILHALEALCGTRRAGP